MIYAQTNEEKQCKNQYNINWEKQWNNYEKVNAVTEIYTQLGIDKLAKEKIDKYFSSALYHLDSICVPAERKKELLSFVQQMMRRER